MINDPSHRKPDNVDPGWILDPAARTSMQEDADLLEIYCRTGKQEAMEALVRRYGPMVAGVARRLLANTNDAEDVFQATFLILIRSAQKIRKTRSIAAWLYGVTYRTAIRVRRRAKLQPVQPIGDPFVQMESDENPLTKLARELELESLDEELQKLPDRIRTPLVEHYFLGFSAPQIAERMDLHVSAVEGRLRRGRKALRQRLARRGISLSVILAGATWFQQQVQAQEMVSWAKSLETSLGTVSNSSQSSASQDPMIQNLIQGELGMKTKTFLRVLSLSGTALCAAGILGLSAAALPSGAASTSGVTVAANNELPETIGPTFETVLANQGVQTPPSQTTSGAPPKTAGGPTVQSTPNISKNPSQNSTSNDPVQFTRPEGAEPSWISSSAEDAGLIKGLRKELNARRISSRWNEAPLKLVVKHISEESGIPIIISEQSLANEGVTSDDLVSLEAPEMRIDSVLDLILAKRGLCYRIQPEYVEIVSQNDPSSEDIRYYDLAYVLSSSAPIPDLVNAIQHSLNGDWDIDGGNSTISTVGSLMIVRTSEKTHRQIEKFLGEIAKISPPNQKAKGQLSNPPGQTNGMGGMGGGMF